MNDNYRRGLATEYRHAQETGQDERAEQVLHELERTGGIPDGLQTTDDTTDTETAVTPRRGRPRKET